MITQEPNQITRPSPIVIRRTINGDMLLAAENEGFSELAARVIAARSVSPKAQSAKSQAAPSLADLDDPATLTDIHAAAERLSMAVMTNEHIGLETDHDVDGVTSHAVLKKGLIECCGHNPTLIHSFIGHRLKEGYGLSQSVAERITSHPHPIDLIITADNGSADEDRIRFLRDRGVDTIVTDHHEIPVTGIPQSALAVLNPTREDCGYPDPLIAGCMVAWLLLVQTIRTLEDYGHLIPGHARPSELLDFVAIGTIADCVSMARSTNNRAVVRFGLKLINAQKRPAWKIAFDELNKEGLSLTEQDIGFGIGPRINARGRLDEAMAGVQFLLSESVTEARQWWQTLDSENEKRKEIERDLKQHAMQIADQALANGYTGLALWLENGHPGVHGIVASRVVEAFGRPTVCLSPVFESDNRVTGSARGVPGFNVKQAFDRIAQIHPQLFLKAGGHEGAGGLTIEKENMPQLIEAWNEAVEIQAQKGEMALAPVIYTDGNLATPVLQDVWQLEAELAPFGREFEQPVWEGEFRLLDVKGRGDGTHLALTLEAQGSIHQAIWFNGRECRADGRLGPAPVQKGQVVNLCFAIENNRFRGRDRLQLRVVAAY